MIVLITVLVLLVVLGGIVLFANAFSNKSSQSSANATATANANVTATANANATATVAPAAQLSGNWVNVDSNTPGITKMTITNNGTNITVHPYSKCSQTDCNWGTQSSQYTGSPFKITFVVNRRSHNLAISTQGTQLKVVEGIRTYLFNKG
jgi:Tfp pilus assembly protein PilV